ncbi:MAG: hypothetical protein GTO03_16830 [Planctomycetales bacterium]|nr:hypothetical protein [Planctomycetales bacterium]
MSQLLLAEVERAAGGEPTWADNDSGARGQFLLDEQLGTIARQSLLNKQDTIL